MLFFVRFSIYVLVNLKNPARSVNSHYFIHRKPKHNPKPNSTGIYNEPVEMMDGLRIMMIFDEALPKDAGSQSPYYKLPEKDLKKYVRVLSLGS